MTFINNGKDINIDIININSKTPESISPSTLPYTILGFHKRENHNALELENKENIEWEKTNNKNLLNDNII